MRSTRSSSTIGGAPLARFVLPVSGIAVSLRQPTGAEDIVLSEHAPDDPVLALMLAQRLGTTNAGVAWADLPVTDIDTLVVRLRQAVVGDRVIAEAMCTVPSCGQRVDLSFGLDTYLAHQRSRKNRTAVATDEPGRYELRGTGPDPVRFRLPSLADQIAAWGLTDPAATLASRCIRPPLPPRRILSRIETAMTTLAPPLAGPIQGRCPDCGTPIAGRFEARGYCLRELRARASFVYGDIDTLAERYHWSEQAILTLPSARRANYAERARQSRAA
jgi:hypothetical protein